MLAREITVSRPNFLPTICMSLLILLCPIIANAQATVALAPVAKQQFFSATGVPLAGGCVSTFVTGTSTPLPAYTDGTGSTQLPNPIILDAGGYSSIWLTNASYRFQVFSAGGLNCATGTLQYTIDNINAFAPISSGANLFLLGQASDPAGTGGELVYRNDIPCIRAFTTFWDCLVRLTDTQTLTNKTLTAPTITNPSISGTNTGAVTFTSPTLVTPIINGQTTGTGINGAGAKLASSASLGGSLPVCTDGSGTLQTTGCAAPVANVANFSAKAQTAAFGSTAVYTCNVLGAPSTCHVRANYYIVTQTSGTGTTASVSITWLDGETSVLQTVTSSNINLGAAGSVQQGTIFIQLANGGTVNYLTTVGSIGTSKYSFYVYIDQLQ